MYSRAEGIADHYWPRAVFSFLDASSHLYIRVCPSVGPSVGPSVRRSVRHAFVKNRENRCFQQMKPREGHKKGRAYLKWHPRISIRGCPSVGPSQFHNSQWKSTFFNKSKQSKACHESHHHAITSSNQRTHRWPYGPCFSRLNVLI